jgi:ribonuclease HII
MPKLAAASDWLTLLFIPLKQADVNSYNCYNYHMILGIDEVGRGPWAGPLVVGAVVLGGEVIEGLTDSKKLTKKLRVELDVVIREKSAGFGLGWVAASEIDEIGLSEALRLATKRAVEQVKTTYHEIIIDGTVNFLDGTTKGNYVTTMKKADLLVPSVSAASIIAKVARDNYMAEQDAIYDGYKFSSHVGYGTAVHVAAIEKNGVTPLHRLSFAPLLKYRSLPSSKFSPKSSHRSLDVGPVDASVPSSHSSEGAAPRVATHAGLGVESNKYAGNKAEDVAAAYLTGKGHEILERNWKTKYCEIDIVSTKNETVYFTEVKYRKKPNQGGGLAAITRRKLNQMQFAARIYVQTKKLHDSDLRLAAASLTGEPPVVETWFVIE